MTMTPKQTVERCIEICEARINQKWQLHSPNFKSTAEFIRDDIKQFAATVPDSPWHPIAEAPTDIEGYEFVGTSNNIIYLMKWDNTLKKWLDIACNERNPQFFAYKSALMLP